MVFVFRGACDFTNGTKKFAGKAARRYDRLRDQPTKIRGPIRRPPSPEREDGRRMRVWSVTTRSGEGP
jgi:hypothetical protein